MAIFKTLLLRPGLWVRCFLATIVVLSSCSQSNNQQEFYIDQYFDLKAMMDRQVAYYQDSAAGWQLSKTVRFDTNKETQVQDVDSLGEVREILETAIINKPGLRGAYKVKWDYGISSRGDTTYSVLSNVLKPEEEALVKVLKVFYKGPPSRNNLYRVHIYKNTDNLLYANAQLIVLQFQDGWMQMLKMEGNQQILNFERERYGLSLKIQSSKTS